MTHHEDHTKDDRERRSFEARMEDFQGRVKKAAGELFDDDELRQEGRIDRLSSSVRDTLNRAVDSAKDLVSSRRDGDEDS
jgi:uncharacterized protein YjbJ (UPF0337 family)